MYVKLNMVSRLSFTQLGGFAKILGRNWLKYSLISIILTK